MPSLIDIRRRVRSVKNTQQITKAMKMVSAAKLRKAQEKALAARPYSSNLRQMLANVASVAAQDPEAGGNPLLATREENRILIVAIAADSGLAGGFNSNILKMANTFAQQNQDKQLSFEVVGKKARDYFKRRYDTVVGETVEISRTLNFGHAETIAETIMRRFSEAEVDAVYVFVNEFKSVMAPELSMTKLLPVDVPESSPDTVVDYLYEQPPAELLGSLLPKYVKTQIYRALLESVAAEHAARMTAMDAATNNAEEVIDNLTLHMNRVRQAAITNEIIEIVSGAAALD